MSRGSKTDLLKVYDVQIFRVNVVVHVIAITFRKLMVIVLKFELFSP